MQRRVGVAGALRVAGGAGGVDDVGEVARRHRRFRVGGAEGFQGVAVLVQAEAGDAFRQRQFGQQVALGQQQPDAAVVEQVGQALAGVFRVEGHIGAAGLEHGQQPHHQLDGTLAGHAHQALRAHTLAAQLVRQAVGAGVELGVGEALAAEGQGRGVRLGGGMGLEQLVNRRVAVVLGGGVPALHLPGQLIGIQQRQLAHRLLRVGDDAAQQVQPVAHHALGGGALEQVGGVGQRRFQAAGFFQGVQLQVELGGAPLPLLAAELQAAEAVQGGHVGHERLVVVEGLEQRVVAEVALHVQRFHQLLEGQFLMSLGTQGGLLDLLQQLGERQLAVELAAQHLGVDEEADQALGFRAVAVGDGHADANLALAAVARQQHLVAGQQEHEQGDALLPGQRAQLLGQRGVDGELQAHALVAGAGRARVVGREFQQTVLAAEVGGPVVQLALLLAGFQPLALPQGVVAVLDGQRRQLRGLACAEGAVQAGELVDQHVHRPAVGDDVVQGHQQQVLVIRQLHQLQAQQRALLQVEGLLRLFLGALAGTGLAGGGRQQGQVFVGDVQLDGLVDALQRHAVHQVEGGAQGLVARHQGGEGLFQGGHVQRAFQTHRTRQVVGRALRVQLPEEPHAALGVGQPLALGNGDVGGNGEQVEVDAFLAQPFEEEPALFHGQLDESVGESQGVLGIHLSFHPTCHWEAFAFRHTQSDETGCYAFSSGKEIRRPLGERAYAWTALLDYGGLG
ncbi:hypothetical protein D9M68_317610 [compost metagenome]